MGKLEHEALKTGLQRIHETDTELITEFFDPVEQDMAARRYFFRLADK